MTNNNPVRILVIDDNTAIHEDFKKILQSSGASTKAKTLREKLFKEDASSSVHTLFELDTATQGEEGLQKVQMAIDQGRPYALVFTDIRMPPGMDGVETVREIWKIDPWIQTVLCTAWSDYDWEKISEQLGRTDRLLILKKPFDSIEVLQFAETLSRKYELAEKVRNQIDSLQELVKERTQALETTLHELEHNVTHDVLTGLPNRTLLFDRLKQIIMTESEPDLLFSVMFLDLNRFKSINDSFGHKAGDLFLKEFGKRLKNSIRDIDTASRIGGDEFVVVLAPSYTKAQVVSVIQRLSAVLSEPFEIEGHLLEVSPGIGVSFYPRDGRNPETLIKNADTAMYRAKMNNRKFEFYGEEMETEANSLLQMESNIRQAIKQKDFLLHYQPLINSITGKITGMEALLRWHHPVLGPVPPQKFIPVAENSGLIVPMGEWVLNAACEQNLKWHKQGLTQVSVSVNLSAIQLKQENILVLITNALEKTGLNPKYLELELTESVIMEDINNIMGKLEQIRDLGVRLVIDDFGTGYSSLSYLKQFPVDKIKIDRSFVSTITDNPESTETSIILAIIAMCHALELRVLAEGIENSEQYEFLRAHGCDEMQGYFLSRPLTPEDMEKVLKDGLVVQKM